jgi:hypothetical protein
MRKCLSGPLSALCLLLLYLAGNVQNESFHQVIHSLEQSLHTAEQEEDPCHRTLYHELENDGCDHKTHLTEIKQCPLCHVVPINVQHLQANRSSQSFKIGSGFVDHTTCLVVVRHFVDLPTRAPPIV